ncbi:MAG TPA: hypothetical protein VN873_01260 [Candidatus Angelobacter sp.]|nr:hypothetical protein [Candidatus Angelobacter sp.]
MPKEFSKKVDDALRVVVANPQVCPAFLKISFGKAINKKPTAEIGDGL